MSATKTLHPDEKYQAGSLGSKMTVFGLGAGVFLVVGAILLALATGDPGFRRFQFGYLTAWIFIYTLATGSLFFVIIHHLTRARWSVTTRRLAENVSRAFPLVGLLGLGFVVPMLAGNNNLYFWSYFQDHPDPHNHHLMGKASWLNDGFFAARFVVYMMVYSGLAYYFANKSRQQDETGDPKLSERMRIAAGPGMLIFALVTVFTGFDVMMSLMPEWYSTIYSVNLFGGAMVGTYAFLAILARAIQKTGRLTRSITVEHYHDLGKLLFGFIFFWAYTAFSQFMLIWYANLPEEVVFYRYRMNGDWMYLSIIVLLCCWAIPYVLLLSRWTKRVLPVFMALCVWSLFFHYIDLYWNVMPNLHWHFADGHAVGPLHGPIADHAYQFAFTDVLLLAGLFALFLGAVGRHMKGNLVPVKDPHLGMSLSFENY
jgi:hypothetical protein